MQKVFFLIPLLYLASCGDSTGSAETFQDSEPPLTETQNDELYAVMNEMETDVSVQINETNASQVTSFENTPKSVVSYFYASWIRGDQEWQKVCPPYEEQTPEFRKAVEQYGTWNFTTYVPQSTYKTEVSFAMEFVDMNGETGGGSRVITVEETAGKYLITEIPAQ